MKKSSFKISLVFALLTLLCCTAVQVTETVKPSPFITRPELLHKPENTPFDLAWMSSNVGVGSWQYDTLIVKAVRTDDLRTDNWLFRAGTLIPTKDAYLEKVSELAVYIQKTVYDNFENYEKKVGGLHVEKSPPLDPYPNAPTTKSFELTATQEVVDTLIPNMRTLVVEISIAEANFGDPIVYGGLLAVPVPGIANLSTAAKSPSLTLEARLVDEQSGQVITELIDRRFPQVKIIDVNRLTISSALNELADSFAEDIVASFYRKTGEKVSKRLPFSLLPW